MAAKPINLRQARKAKARAAKRAQGDANAATFGLTKAARTRQAAEAEAARRKLDAHRRDPDDGA